MFHAGYGTPLDRSASVPKEVRMLDTGTVAAIGGVLLALAILYAVIMNRRRSNADVQRTEEATKDLYERIDRHDKVSDPDPKRF
jgi:hypothetical protein